MPKSPVLTIPNLVRGTLQLRALSARNGQVEKMCGNAWTMSSSIENLALGFSIDQPWPAAPARSAFLHLVS
jgi:hypothetical protein